VDKVSGYLLNTLLLVVLCEGIAARQKREHLGPFLVLVLEVIILIMFEFLFFLRRKVIEIAAVLLSK